MKDSRRMRQVNRLILEELGALLLTEFEDPELRRCVTVTGVETNRDLRHAHVYISILADEERHLTFLDSVQKQAKHLRYLLGQRVRLKYLPELQFHIDETEMRARRIEQVLEEVLPHESPDELDPAESDSDGSTGDSQDR